MRRKIASFLAIVAGSMSLTGCAIGYLAPVRPPTGAFISTFKAPLSVDFSNTPVCTKQGTASTYYFFNPFFPPIDFAWGEADAKAAAAQGNLKNVEYADFELLTIFGIFGKFTVTAYGN